MVADSDLRAVVRAVGGFADLPEAHLDALIAGAEPRLFAPGEILMAQDDASDFADLLFEGEAEISAGSAHGGVPIGVVRAPALIGEVAAFAGLPRTATVRARSEIRALRIGKAALLEAARAAPKLLIEAIGRLGDRLRRVNGAISLYTQALDALERGKFPPQLMEELRNPAPELVDFGETFARMAKEILLRRQRNDEMASAAIIQRALLPDPRIFAAETGVDLHAAMTPARDVGGDFFDLIALGDGRVAFGVGDVCGKGVPAALYMGISKTLIRIKLRERPDLVGAIRDANEYLTAHYPAEQFATLLYAAYDPSSGAIEYVSCGHPAARIRRADGRIEALAAGGLPVGMFEELKVVSRSARLDRGDLLMIFSDGVTEASDATACEFGEARLCEALAAEEGDAAAAVNAVVAAARAFAGGEAQSDDITCLALVR
jgi:sigma-B regulation protein RsbU (phosphoserine phosphatase)